jgi:hypothetical protein
MLCVLQGQRLPLSETSTCALPCVCWQTLQESPLLSTRATATAWCCLTRVTWVSPAPFPCPAYVCVCVCVFGVHLPSDAAVALVCVFCVEPSVRLCCNGFVVCR